MVNNSKLIHFRVQLIRNTNLVQTRVSVCHQSADRATPADNYDHSDETQDSGLCGREDDEGRYSFPYHVASLFFLKSYFKLTLGTIEFALEVEQ